MHKPWYSFLYVKSPIAKIAWGILAVLGSIAIILLLGLIEEPRMEAQTSNWDGRGIEKGAELFANNCASCHGLEGQGGAGPALNSRYFFTQRLNDIAFTGSLEAYIALTVAAGRPSKGNSGQWSVMMPTWSNRFGGPLRDDQVQQVTDYVLNWESTAVLQTPDEDPWIPFQDTPSKASPEDMAGQPPAEGEAPAGPRPPQQIFVALGCSGCHNLNEPQTDNNRGPIGPNMANLNENAPNRVPGEDASTYVHNSIANPNAYIVSGYQPNLMPMGLADRMTTEEMDALVAWLLDPNRAQ
jgi:mono/diheme cytochrome c family protein